MGIVNRNRLTNNSDETDIASLISGDTVFSIPFFQRSYKWKPERLRQLNQDILELVDEASEVHFLGAVIVHGRSSNPSDPKVYEIIDGQQRITTLFLYIAAAIKILTENSETVEASGLFLKYLAIPRQTNLPSNLKLQPCKDDRSQFAYVIKDLLKDEAFKAQLGSWKIKWLPPSGSDTGALRNNYKSALRFFRSQFEQGGLDNVRAVYRKMLECMSVVQIDVWDPTNGPKIFDSLNSRQEPMTIGDLIRNEIFARVANEHPNEIEQIDQHDWQPFYKKFQSNGHNLFDTYFFPYGLVQDPNLKKSQVYAALREKWKNKDDPKAIIKELSEYQDAFIDIITGQNTQLLPPDVATLFGKLVRSRIPSSTYPFLMQLSQAVKVDAVVVQDACDSLKVIESFLVRRAVCGQEPTGLHAVFKRLWNDCDGRPSRETVEREIRKHKTVVWPNDSTFAEAINARPLYGVGITLYVVTEYDQSLGGDLPNNTPWLEHVLPQAPVPQWFDTFTKDQHREMEHRLANLIPLSKEMNSSVGNNLYVVKRKIYGSDSMYKSARQFAQRYDEWSPSTLESRGFALAKWAVSRWPY